MEILLSSSSDTPIYEQITTQIREMILSGRLKSGDPLPSMRLLAKELRISVITTKHAYEELERQGLIVSFTGKGSFVSQMPPSTLQAENLAEIQKLIRQAVEKARNSGISFDTLTEILNSMKEN